MGMRIDEKEFYKKKIDRFKDEIARKNRELQKEREKRKKEKQ
jgi:hypothetical protein